MRIKNFEVELADDFSKKESKKGVEYPYYKRWRCWANGVCIGDIYKVKNAKTGEPNYKLNCYKADIGDYYSYLRAEGIFGVQYTYQRDGVPGRKDPRKTEGFKTLKEAVKAFKKRFINNILHLIEP